MAKKELQNRLNWQTESGPAGKSGIAEQNFYDVFNTAFKSPEYANYILTDHPKNFKHLYENVQLSSETLRQIYTPEPMVMEAAQHYGWGVSPDFSITNTVTGKILFGEIKRQDGWVEGKSPSAGRGNAHERLCKLFAPGIIKAYRQASGIWNPEILPFWVVLEGDITRDPKRNREIAFWFDKYDKNYFMWRPGVSGQVLIDHFNNYLRKYLE